MGKKYRGCKLYSLKSRKAKRRGPRSTKGENDMPKTTPAESMSQNVHTPSKIFLICNFKYFTKNAEA